MTHENIQAKKVLQWEMTGSCEYDFDKREKLLGFQDYVYSPN